MDELRLARAIESLVGEALALAIATEYVKLRRDVSTGTLERVSVGKFVESFVQGLQWIMAGQYDTSPKVDYYLRSQVECETSLPDGLRICASRVARALYTMRNKRNIAHKGEIDPNRVDLEFSHHGAAWIMAELIRTSRGITMEEAASLIGLVNLPVGPVVEDIDGTRIVHADLPIRSILLLLLHSEHPDRLGVAQLAEWSRKKPDTVRARLSEMRRERLLVGGGGNGYMLTSAGHSTAAQLIQKLQSSE